MYRLHLVLLVALIATAVAFAQTGPKADDIPTCVVSGYQQNTAEKYSKANKIPLHRRNVIPQPSHPSTAPTKISIVTASAKKAFCQTSRLALVNRATNPIMISMVCGIFNYTTHTLTPMLCLRNCSTTFVRSSTSPSQPLKGTGPPMPVT